MLSAEESHTLLSFISAIAPTRDTDELLRTIIAKLQPVLDFHDAELFVVNKEKDYYHRLTTQTPDKQLLRQPYRGSWIAEAIQRVETSGGPVRLTYPERVDHSTRSQSAEYQEHLATTLRIRDEVIGLVCFRNLQQDHFRPEQFDLFQAVADPIAITLSHILAKERVEQLLNISQAIIEVQDRQQLLKTIYQRVKPIFPYDTFGLFVLTEDKQQHYELVDAELVNHLAQDLIEHRYGAHYRYQHTGSPIEAWMQQGPGLFWLIDYMNHDQAPLMYEAGLRQIIAGPLIYGGEPIGMLCFNSKQEDFYTEAHLPLFTAIAEQMSIAAANVLANEQLREEKQFKEALLGISEAAARIQERKQLFEVIFRHIQPIIPFDYPGLFIVDPSGEYYVEQSEEEITTALDTLLPNQMDKQTALPREAVMDFWKGRSEPAIYPLEEVRQEVGYTDRGQGVDLKQVMAAPLVYADRIMGVLCLNSQQEDQYQAHDLSSFQAIAHQLSVAVANVLAHEEIVRLNHQLQQENTYLEEEIQQHYNPAEMVGESEALQETFRQVRQVAKTTTTVLITGETGTGKELVARALHQLSDRSDRPLIKVNCATLPTELVESELFGYEKGAFTGALQQRIGKFELAHQGTIFLDEIGELPLNLQSKLLRVLQEREIERLGGQRTIQLNLRILAATNRDLAKEIQQGRFRSDLFYRLNVFPLRVPPLRERLEDVELLTQHFVKKYSKRIGKSISKVSAATLKAFRSYPWPGNVRELEHTVERAVVLSQTSTLHVALPSDPATLPNATSHTPAIQPLKEAERKLILRTLAHTQGRIRGVGGAAELLEINPSTLESRMAKLGIQKKFVSTRK